MESQPQNPEFRNNPENFHPCAHIHEIRVWMTAETKEIRVWMTAETKEIQVWMTAETKLLTQQWFNILYIFAYSKTCVKEPLKSRQNKDLNDKW